ncbi:hypothetical protein VP01_725g2 [Puccinia sorghi]|uniref:Uncharacterized protein n=1 Tax=Puccinia sorghi TaxID=27349 RepID=A0A0L6UDY5_9BASI|nr:hypothetical protein VP01_725g2 [Puccinia sorghi]
MLTEATLPHLSHPPPLPSSHCPLPSLPYRIKPTKLPHADQGPSLPCVSPNKLPSLLIELAGTLQKFFCAYIFINYKINHLSSKISTLLNDREKTTAPAAGILIYIIKLNSPLGYSSMHFDCIIAKGFYYLVELQRISTELRTKFTKIWVKIFHNLQPKHNRYQLILQKQHYTFIVLLSKCLNPVIELIFKDGKISMLGHLSPCTVEPAVLWCRKQPFTLVQQTLDLVPKVKFDNPQSMGDLERLANSAAEIYRMKRSVSFSSLEKSVFCVKRWNCKYDEQKDMGKLKMVDIQKLGFLREQVYGRRIEQENGENHKRITKRLINNQPKKTEGIYIFKDASEALKGGYYEGPLRIRELSQSGVNLELYHVIYCEHQSSYVFPHDLSTTWSCYVLVVYCLGLLKADTVVKALQEMCKHILVLHINPEVCYNKLKSSNRCVNKFCGKDEHNTAKKNLLNCLQLTCSLLKPSCHPNAILHSDCASKLGLLWEKGGSNTKNLIGLSECQLQAVEQVSCEVKAV